MLGRTILARLSPTGRLTCAMVKTINVPICNTKVPIRLTENIARRGACQTLLVSNLATPTTAR